MIIRAIYIGAITLSLALSAQAAVKRSTVAGLHAGSLCISIDRPSPSQQSTDEAECYQWAVNTSGSDPFAVQNQQAAQAQQTEAAQQQASQTAKGSGAKGTLGGAAAGA